MKRKKKQQNAFQFNSLLKNDRCLLFGIFFWSEFFFSFLLSIWLKNFKLLILEYSIGEHWAPSSERRVKAKQVELFSSLERTTYSNFTSGTFLFELITVTRSNQIWVCWFFSLLLPIRIEGTLIKFQQNVSFDIFFFIELLFNIHRV